MEDAREFHIKLANKYTAWLYMLEIIKNGIKEEVDVYSDIDNDIAKEQESIMKLIDEIEKYINYNLGTVNDVLNYMLD